MSTREHSAGLGVCGPCSTTSADSLMDSAATGGCRCLLRKAQAEPVSLMMQLTVFALLVLASQFSRNPRILERAFAHKPGITP